MTRLNIVEGDSHKLWTDRQYCRTAGQFPVTYVAVQPMCAMKTPLPSFCRLLDSVLWRQSDVLRYRGRWNNGDRARGDVTSFPRLLEVSEYHRTTHVSPALVHGHINVRNDCTLDFANTQAAGTAEAPVRKTTTDAVA